MTSSLFCLLALAPTCRLSLHEKGKKRAKSVKCLIPGSLVGTATPSSISLRSYKPRPIGSFYDDPVPETWGVNASSVGWVSGWVR